MLSYVLKPCRDISFCKRVFYTSNVLHRYTKEWAKHFVSKLNADELEILRNEIESLNLKHDKEILTKLSTSDLKRIALAHGLPFVGFGLLDNAIMILAGEYIDERLGSILGISTMAAAALGNLISDAMGLGTVGYVEALALKFGVKLPPLTPELRQSFRFKTASNMGRLIGITIGCLIGMFPLLLFDYSKCEHPDHKLDNKSDKTDSSKSL